MAIKKKVFGPLRKFLSNLVGHQEDLYMVICMDKVAQQQLKHGRHVHEVHVPHQVQNIWVGADAANAAALHCVQAYDTKLVGIFKMTKLVGYSRAPVVEEEQS